LGGGFGKTIDSILVPDGAERRILSRASTKGGGGDGFPTEELDRVMASSSVLLRIKVAKRRFRANWFFVLWVVKQLMIMYMPNPNSMHVGWVLF
jgi:hypothetical protein